MGGGKKRSRTQRRHFKESRENVWKKDRSNDRTSANPSWEPFATQNSSFEEYYKEQRIVLEEEWDAFLSILRKPLPAAFRINSSGQFFEGIRFQLENDFMKSLELEIHNENMEVEAIRPLPWYPENLAWHSNFSRMQLRKNQALERFHQFLMLENTIGNISRQEAVSMVPALLLDICSDHFVLDMCAAPGSKTFQLLEMMHRSSELGTLPNGMVIANDADVQRCNLLIHQTKRMCSANLIVTNHLAQHFPSCHLKDKSSISSTISCQSGEFIGIYEPDDGHKTLMKTELLFDRVLCDVPCSGDGTLRKAPDIWRKWSVGLGNGIHRLQVQIAMRGIALLKVGGRMVYSTCSMNPIENEAVVAEVLRRCGGSVELLDVSSELPQLIRRPGLKNWKVRDKGSWLTSYNDVSTHRRSAIVPSMFPSYQSYDAKETVNGAMNFNDMKENGTIPCSNYEHQNEGLNEPSKMSKSSQVVYEGETSEFPLERCMRIVPHDQNSGAFFIAVFQKLFYRPVTESSPSSMSKDITNSTPENEDSEAAVEEREFAKDILEDIPEKLPLLEESTSADNMEETVPENDMAIESFDDTKENSTICKGKSDLNKQKMENRKIQIQGKWKGVDPVVFFQDNTTISVIRSFYGIESFPLDGHLVSRSSDAQHVKRIYYISKSVRNVLKLNFHVGQQLKITSIGLKIFERQTAKEDSRHSSPCPYRISSEGLPLLLPYITKQILYASLTDFEHLLEYRSIKFLDFVEPGFGEKASNLTLGCCVIVLNLIDVGSTSDITRIDSSTVALGCWKGRTNISVMASEVDCRGLLERLSIRLGRPLGRKTLNDQNSSQSNSSSITETLEDDTAK